MSKLPVWLQCDKSTRHLTLPFKVFFSFCPLAKIRCDVNELNRNTTTVYCKEGCSANSWQRCLISNPKCNQSKISFLPVLECFSLVLFLSRARVGILRCGLDGLAAGGGADCSACCCCFCSALTLMLIWLSARTPVQLKDPNDKTELHQPSKRTTLSKFVAVTKKADTHGSLKRNMNLQMHHKWKKNVPYIAFICHTDSPFRTWYQQIQSLFKVTPGNNERISGHFCGETHVNDLSQLVIIHWRVRWRQIRSLGRSRSEI